MKTLLVLRHAKAVRDDPGGDFRRGLTKRGRAAAAQVGAYLATQGLRPDLVLCSSSVRTRETLAGLGTAAAAGTRFEDPLYLADAPALLERIRAVPAGTGCLLLVGHNPGCEDLALHLAAPSPERARMEEKFPTAALAWFETAGAWRDLERATLRAFVVPADLDEE